MQTATTKDNKITLAAVLTVIVSIGTLMLAAFAGFQAWQGYKGIELRRIAEIKSVTAQVVSEAKIDANRLAQDIRQLEQTLENATAGTKVGFQIGKISNQAIELEKRLQNLEAATQKEAEKMSVAFLKKDFDALSSRMERFELDTKNQLVSVDSRIDSINNTLLYTSLSIIGPIILLLIQAMFGRSSKKH